MMRKLIGILSLAMFAASAQANVAVATLTSGVEQRTPVDDLGNEYVTPVDQIGKVYFFTALTDLARKQVTHRWLYDGEVMADVMLNVGSDYWRTYSSKRIVSGWKGSWQVQVIVDEQVVYQYDFTVN